MLEAGQAGERNYKAFISYRHKPLDMETAKKLHRRIEQYLIPADVRRNGQKKLGLVFRDQDELPIANNLTENIRIALDHSEFLIVVCTPDTPGSVWVQREIAYFREHHDENHVLAILADGTPETSFPPQLTEIRDVNGRVTDVIEPLAANIVAPTKARRNRLFRTESLRILASLIGCPYDSLYRREQRRRMRQFAAGVAVVGVILAVFIGVLLNRNAEIRQEHRNTQINESRILAVLSENADREGDYRGSVQYALSGLPERDPERVYAAAAESESKRLAMQSENADREGNYRGSIAYALSALLGQESGRPYVAAAEYALSKALYLYQGGFSMRYIQSFDQDADIIELALSSGSEYLATADLYGKLRMYEAVSGKLLWEAQVPERDVSELSFCGKDRVLVTSRDTSGRKVPNTVCYAVRDGEVLWQLEPTLYASSEEKDCALAVDSLNNELKIRVRKVDLQTGTILREIQDPDRTYPNSHAYALSPDGRYAAMVFKGKDDFGEVVIYDLEEGSIRSVSTVFLKPLYVSFMIRFTHGNELAVTCSGNSRMLQGKEGWEGPYIALLDPALDWQERFHTALDFGEAVQSKFGVVDDSDYPNYLQCQSDSIAVAAKKRLIMVEHETGAIRWVKDLPGYIKAAEMYENGSLGLALSNGLITLCEGTTGTLSQELQMGSFECEYNLYRAEVEGSRYRVTCHAVVSEKNPTRVAMIAFTQGEDLEAYPFAENIPYGANVYSSPSGRTGAAIAVNDDYTSYQIFLLDLTGKKEPLAYTLRNIRTGVRPSQIFVTDEGKVIVGDHMVDPEGEQEAWMTGRPDDWPVWTPEIQSCRETGTGAVLSVRLQETEDGGCMLHVWKDGEPAGSYPVPVDEDGEEKPRVKECVCVAAGGSGYAVAAVRTVYGGPWQYSVFSLTDGTVQRTDCLNPEGEQFLAIADAHAWMAVQETEGELRLVDLSSGKTLLVFDSPLPGRGVRKLLFANEDQWLLAFTDAGGLGIFSTADGHLLHQSSFLANLIRFSSDARYEAFLVPEQNRLLILDRDEQYTEPFCISMDTRSFETNGLYLGFSNWLPSQGKALIAHAEDTICLAPLLTLEEIQAKGVQFLEEGLKR